MRSTGWVSIVASAMLLLPYAGRALAQETRETETASMFPKGLWTLHLHGAYLPSYETDDEVSYGTVGGSYYFDERHSLLIEFVGYGLDNAGDFDADDAAAGGGNLGLRYQFLEHQRLSFFVEGLAGFLQANHNFPPGGTHFNFALQAGLGATFRIADNMHLIGGARYLHISNAQIEGKDRNPNFNAVGGYLGVMFTF